MIRPSADDFPKCKEITSVNFSQFLIFFRNFLTLKIFKSILTDLKLAETLSLVDTHKLCNNHDQRTIFCACSNFQIIIFLPKLGKRSIYFS